MEPTGLTTTSAATVVPSASTALAEPIPPLSWPALAPVPAPTTPWDTASAPAADRAAR